MSTLKRKDNDAELAVRRLLYASGYRYRVHYPVPGLPRRTIDIAFTRDKVAVFIDGCFWHGCPEHGTKPRSNSDWWAAKLTANTGRDLDTTAHLEGAGWTVTRLWEHESAASAFVQVDSLFDSSTLRLPVALDTHVEAFGRVDEPSLVDSEKHQRKGEEE